MKKKTIFVLLAILVIIICALVFLKDRKPSDDKSNNSVSANRIEIPTNIIKNEIIDNSQSGLIQDPQKENDGKNYAEGQVVVVTDKSLESLKEAISGNSKLKDVKIETTVKDKNKNVFLISSDKYTMEELKKNLQDVGINSDPNYITHIDSVTNDAYINYQWAIENSGQNGGTSGLDINPIVTSGSDEKVIVVVDSGVDYNHNDLKNVMWKNTDGSYGYDFVNKDADPMDDNGHGTHCAGIIAGSANSEGGVSGAVLECSNIKIMALKAFGSDGSGLLTDAISAYEYIRTAQQSGVNIIAVNDSWSITGDAGTSGEYLKQLIDEVGQAGAVSVCAAGNKSSNIDSVNVIPADLDSDYIITVSASNVNDELSNFSNYGKNNSDIAAPGSNILSTVPYNVFNPTIYTRNPKK